MGGDDYSLHTIFHLVNKTSLNSGPTSSGCKVSQFHLDYLITAATTNYHPSGSGQTKPFILGKSYGLLSEIYIDWLIDLPQRTPLRSDPRDLWMCPFRHLVMKRHDLTTKIPTYLSTFIRVQQVISYYFWKAVIYFQVCFENVFCAIIKSLRIFWKAQLQFQLEPLSLIPSPHSSEKAKYSIIFLAFTIRPFPASCVGEQ